MGKWCLHASSLIFDRIVIKVAGNQDRHKSLDEFDFGPLVSMAHLYIFWSEIWPWHIGHRWAIVALWATCFYFSFALFSDSTHAGFYWHSPIQCVVLFQNANLLICTSWTEPWQPYSYVDPYDHLSSEIYAIKCVFFFYFVNWHSLSHQGGCLLIHLAFFDLTFMHSPAFFVYICKLW